MKAGIPLPHHAALDKNERWLYFAESGSDRIRRIDLQEGTLHNFAGIGETCYSGDEGPCAEAGLYLPLDVAFDSQNDLYICDSGSNRIRKVDRETGMITTVVGTGQHGFNGDGPALEVNLTWPAAMAFDKDDVLYIADTQAHKIRRYDPRTGMVTTIAGAWTAEDDAREQPFVARNLVVLSGDAIGIDFSDDHGWLMPVCSDGLDMSMYLDDGKPAMEARLYDVVGIAVDGKGDVVIVDKGSNRVRKIDRTDGHDFHGRRRLPLRLRRRQQAGHPRHAARARGRGLRRTGQSVRVRHDESSRAPSGCGDRHHHHRGGERRQRL